MTRSPARSRRLAAALVTIGIAAAIAPAARAATVRGTVYVDRNGDGLLSPGEPGVAGAVVAWGTTVFTRTDAGGGYALTVPDGTGGDAWVRIPDGFVPGPVWQHVWPVDDGPAIDLGLRPLTDEERARPLTFVVAADAHMQGDDTLWTEAELTTAITQATALDPPPRFFTILGDLTQANQPTQFDQLAIGLRALAVPWVPVPGNHDWYDHGAAYHEHFGPDNYSFDVGDVHFVVWNSMMDEDEIGAFLHAELALVAPGTTVVALGHAPPEQPVVDALMDAGVDYVLCGHWHANRVLAHGAMLELDTEPFVMGGMDMSPAGYRVVTIEHGRLSTYHRTVVDAPYLRIVSPTDDACASPDGFELLVDAAIDAGTPRVTATVDDDAAAIALAPIGGWVQRAHLALSPGVHQVTVEARSLGGRARATAMIEVCDDAVARPRAGDWPALQGGPDHRGARDAPLAPPLVTAWTAAVGGHVHMGAPVVAGGTVFVTVTDFGRGDGGGLVALDLATGAPRWRWASPLPVRNAPAVAGGAVVVSQIDGTVIALDAATGARRWSVALGTGIPKMVTTLWASPTIADGVVYVGIQRHFAAIDLATGHVRWQNDPVPTGEWHGTFTSAAVAAGLVIDAFNPFRGGLVAWDVTTGAERWRLTGGPATALHASPVIAGDTVYLANGRDEAVAVDLHTGDVRWKTLLDSHGDDWGFVIAGTPALARGRLFVPTQYQDLIALDARTGAVLWRHAAGLAPIHPTHYRGRVRGYQGSPLVTGDLVWIGGDDGTLTALDAAHGTVVWHRDLGAPVLAGLAAAGDYLIVASYDGTVRALIPAPPAPPLGDRDTAGIGTALLIALATAIATLWRRRR